jgi:signal transduction histidine kinase
LITNSGRKLLLSVLVSPVGHQGAGAIIVFRDITKEKTEEREMAEFISTASHEMRTPVATIEGYLALAVNPQTASIDEKARLYITKAQESVGHLGELFQDLLDISRVDDGRLKNNPKIVETVAFVDELVANFMNKAKEKGLVLLYKPTVQTEAIRKLSQVLYVNADNNHLREVVSNLIENAVKYTKQGNVTVDVTSPNQEKVLISVHDTGIGIPPEACA